MDETDIRNARLLFDKYDLYFDVILKDKREFLGKRGVCRYCKKTPETVSFKKEAHAFPELIGNKLLFSLDECDICNEYFDKNTENDLANFLGIARTAFKIKGKKGIPNFKNKRGDRVEVVDGDIVVIESGGASIMQENIESKTLSIKVEKNTYTPINVYKCFTKMALAIIPELEMELGRFDKTIKWIRDDVKPLDYNKNFFKVISTFVPGNKPFRLIRAMLFKRKSASNFHPYILCVICFGNYMFQFFLPFSKKDRLLDVDKIAHVPFPLPISLPGQMAKPQARLIDLSSENKVNGDDEVFFAVNNFFSDIEKEDLPEEIIKRISDLGLKFQ